MAKNKVIDTQVYNTVVKYAKHLQVKGITVNKVLVFGSRAKGNAKQSSDIDVCIVSPEFGKNELKELQFLLYQTHAIDDRIEPIPVSITDFQTNATPLINEIKKYGQTIHI